MISGLRPSSLDRYSRALRLHVLPRIAQLKVSEINIDTAAQLVTDLQPAGSQRTPAGQPGERHQRPKIQRNETRILNREEVSLLLENANDGHKSPPCVELLTSAAVGITESASKKGARPG